MINQIFVTGDCLNLFGGMRENSVDLIITSPPYAMQRKDTYGGISEEEYVEWFLERAAYFKRALKEDGSFILNIREHCEDGERSDYVLRLILALKNQLGFKWIDEYIWDKKGAMPIKVKTRFRNVWERVLHFSPSITPKFYPDEVKVAPAESTVKRLNQALKKDEASKLSESKSGFQAGVSVAQANRFFKGDGKVYPTNLLSISKETRGGKHGIKHPAVFPEKLPEFFIKLMTKKGDMVIDPFCGSGTVGVVCKRLGRNFIGTDTCSEYTDLAEQRVEDEPETKE